MTMTWEHGRQLSTLTKGSDSISYTYNADGVRTSKTVNGQTTEYILDGSTILGEKLPDGEYLYYLYDENGVRYGFARGSLLYYYVCNAQGDVVKILTSGGATAAWYEYDAWGNVVSIGGNAYVANLNPIRYRGYYYDTETGFYYLNSRYYDPEIRRFISADNFKSEKASMETLHNRNLFAYCDDNPLVRADQDGNAWMVAAASFVAGMGLSVGCQMIFEGKNLSEINWITAASAGLGTAMGFLGIGGSTTGAVVRGVTSFASDYYENRDFTSAVINGAVSAGISLILNPLASMGPEKRGYLEYMRKDYHNANRKILNMNLSFSEALPLRSAVNEEKSRKIRQLAEEEISSYCGDYACNAFVNSNIAIRKYGRVIGGGCEYTPGKGTRYMKCYKYLGKLYWVYV